MAMSQQAEHLKCDLCEEESATSYCEDCQLKLGELCHKSHERQKATQTHKLIDIGKTNVCLLNVQCSACEDNAAAFCEHCADLLCERCSRIHKKIPATKDHVISDVLTPSKDDPLNSGSDGTPHVTEGSLLSKSCGEDSVAGKGCTPGDETDVHSTMEDPIHLKSDTKAMHVSEIDDLIQTRTDLTLVEPQSDSNDGHLQDEGNDFRQREYEEAADEYLVYDRRAVQEDVITKQEEKTSMPRSSKRTATKKESGRPVKQAKQAKKAKQSEPCQSSPGLQLVPGQVLPGPQECQPPRATVRADELPDGDQQPHFPPSEASAFDPPVEVMITGVSSVPPRRTISPVRLPTLSEAVRSARPASPIHPPPSSGAVPTGSFQQPSQMAMSQQAKHLQCDLCEEESATSYCEDCQLKLGELCHKSHAKQKATQTHKLMDIVKTNICLLNVQCSACEDNAAAFCEHCADILCKRCSKIHKKIPATKNHVISDVLTPSNDDRLSSGADGTPHVTEDRLLNKTCGEDSVAGKDCTPRDESDVLPTMEDHRNLCSDNNAMHVSQTDDLMQASTDLTLVEPQSDSNDGALQAKGNDFHQREYEEAADEYLVYDRRAVQEDVITKQEETTSDTPGKPSAVAVLTDYIEIIWEKPDRVTENDTYQVRYKAHPNGKWTFYPDEFPRNNGKISGLKTDTSYVFKVRLVTENGESRYSEESEAIRTQTSFASNLLNSATRIEHGDTSPEVYLLPMTENRMAMNETHLTRKYDIVLKKLCYDFKLKKDGTEVKFDVSEKTIMLLGATGTGKSTLVDGLANYILGVNFEDPYRFTLASEDERKKQGNQSVSQTDWITCYSFHPQKGTKINYQLNVIDTPGFGDTRGLERDPWIVEQIRYLFSNKDATGVRFIDAVCFLVKAPDARLTATQKYVFQSLVSLFGKDIEHNICTLITFADGSDPPVLAAINESGLPFGNHFTFNNSALFAQNVKPSKSLAPMFWEMGFNSYVAFFHHLQGNETKSLQLTTEVLAERHRLELNIEDLQRKIDGGLSTVQKLKDRKNTFEENQAQINANKDFKYEETETKQIKEDLDFGTYVTNCLNCNVTCHPKCTRADDDDKKFCRVMDFDGNCTRCPSQCHWDVHKNAKYRFKYVDVKVKKTYKEMLKKYQEAEGRKLDLEEMLNKIQFELDDLTSIIELVMTDINECTNRLKEIALRPNPLDIVEQIDLMIQAERFEQRGGYQRRIDVLMDFRKRATFRDSVRKFETEKSSVQGGKRKGLFEKLYHYCFK